MIKRILTLISMLFIAVNIGVSADELKPDYELLYNLNIVSDTYENYLQKNSVTQSEFLNSLVNIISDEPIAPDMVGEYAKAMNIITKVNTAELNSAISYERALSLTLNVLGYSEIVAVRGNDVNSVLSLANESRLTNGISLKAGDKLNGESMITLLANATDADMISVNMLGTEVVLKKSDKNPLEAFREIYKITGQVTQTTETSLYDEEGALEGNIKIDDKMYDIGYDYSDEILGQISYVYVKDDTVVHIAPRYTDNERIEISADDIISVSDDFTEIVCESGTKTKRVKLNPALTVIYNGKNYKDYKKEDLMPHTGNLVCIDTDRDRKSDIVFVYSYETMVVRNVSVLYSIIENVFEFEGCTQILDLSDSSTDVRIYNDGQKASISSIAVNNVLSVAVSKSEEKTVTIYIGKEKINGTVKKLEENSEGKKVATVGDAEYTLNHYYKEALAAEGSKIDSLKTGSAYDFYLDVFGNIAFAKGDKLNGYEYAFVLKLWKEDSMEEAGVKMMNVDGEWEKVSYTQKIKLNDKKMDAVSAYKELGGNEFEPQLVLVKRELDGKISALKTAQVTNRYTPDKFSKTNEVSRYYWEGDSSFNCRHYLEYDALIVLIPTEEANKYDEESYSVSTVGYFKDWQSYKYTAYNVDEFGFPGAFVVRDKHLTSSAMMYVNEVISQLNEDDEEVKAIVGNYRGIENLTIIEEPGAITAKVKPGDIVELKLRNGRITELSVVHSADAPRTYASPTDDYHVHEENTKVFGDVIGIDPERRMILVDCQEETIPVSLPGETDIEVYDKEMKKFVVATINDIYKGNYARVLMANNEVTSIVIFQ